MSAEVPKTSCEVSSETAARFSSAAVVLLETGSWGCAKTTVGAQTSAPTIDQGEKFSTDILGQSISENGMEGGPDRWYELTYESTG